jgi:regulator of RNase E activity RraA
VNPHELFEQYHDHAGQLYSAVLADVMDAMGYRQQAVDNSVVGLDRTWRLFGKARTLAMKPVDRVPDEPYQLEMKAIDHLQPGDVLVIAMAGCPQCAVWGELLSTACKARGAVGALMDGPTRDAEKILALGFPTFAAGTSPLDSKGRIDGSSWDEPVKIGNVGCKPGDFVYGDSDGVVVIPFEIAPAVLEAALAKVSGENMVRAELAAGRPVSEVFKTYGIL